MQNYFYDEKTTIASIVTGKGQAGVGIIRISGLNAKSISEKIIKKEIKEERKAIFTKFKNSENKIIDEGIILYFKKPNSFTGEDVIEFQGHGGSVVLNLLLEEIIKNGARQAIAGEFSSRAFFNNKIDLVQAEAIADLIAAESRASAQSAINSMQGIFSEKVRKIVQELINIRMYVEASIDFSDEDIDFLENEQIKNKFVTLSKNLDSLLKEADKGKSLQDGMNIVLVGNPNVGKSSLLNCLTGMDTAIVTDIEGTTRDIIKETINIKGVPIRIFDTAGIRDTQNIIEAEGIKRSKQALKKADKILWIIDQDKFAIDENILSKQEQKEYIEQDKLIFIRNKIDLENKEPQLQKFDLKTKQPTIIKISAKQNLGIDILLDYLEELINKNVAGEGIFSARLRHLNSLQLVNTYMQEKLQSWQQIKQIELFAEDLRIMQKELESITGKFSNDDLLTEIFSGFCIGK